jgi:hypothetical protein
MADIYEIDAYSHSDGYNSSHSAGPSPQRRQGSHKLRGNSALRQERAIENYIYSVQLSARKRCSSRESIVHIYDASARTQVPSKGIQDNGTAAQIVQQTDCTRDPLKDSLVQTNGARETKSSPFSSRYSKGEEKYKTPSPQQTFKAKKPVIKARERLCREKATVPRGNRYASSNISVAESLR